MRAALVSFLSALVLGLGVTTSIVQSQNHALAAELDDTQRRTELSRMWILSAEASILAGESLSISETSEDAEEQDGRPSFDESVEGYW